MSEVTQEEDMVNTEQLNDSELGEDVDDWAAAMAEQPVCDEAEHQHSSQTPTIFPQFVKPQLSKKDKVINSIPVKLTVELGESDLTIEEISQLGKGSVVVLQELAGEELKIKANGVLVAKGEAVIVNDKFGVRITEVLSDD